MTPPAIHQGAVLDGFRIGARIHRGAMAMLWEVTHPDINLPLLLKAPVISEGADPAAIVGFEMEQMILPRLSGPHVPRFIAKGEASAQPYLVMERIPGSSLLPLLPKLPLPWPEVVSLGARIAQALDDLHRQHLVHLDVKPSNILLRPSGEAVLVDYGLSRHDHLPDLMGEEFRLPYGTGPYMAPEQVMGCRSDSRSDLFALGVLLYFFTTGVRPFGDPQRLSGLKRRLWRDPFPPRHHRPDCPPWLQEIILRCLEVYPAWRHPTAAQLAFDLLHPDQVKLTARSERLRRDSLLMVLRRRFNQDHVHPRGPGRMPAHAAEAPIVAVAVDLSEAAEVGAEALRTAVRQALQSRPGARLACLNVLKQGVLTLDDTLDAEGRNKHLQRLVALRHWAEPLGLEEGWVSFHVLEAPNPATAILGYVHTNHVDHVILGARAQSLKRTLLGSVSGEVAAHSPCTVTIVRTRRKIDRRLSEAGAGDDSWTVG
ncbi:MAG TPA: bifunctional serine/threonine-protein kinase/universal stress protein [Holophagaceae bacterium]|nr:bifunctional serine/threonine-protein kinase/universal stress protein [Holophagaceae bacterium]